MAFPSTFLDLQRTVVNKIRLSANADAGTGDDLQFVKDIINQAYAQVCVETEANQTSGTAALTAGVYSYALSTSILRIRQILIQAVGTTGYGTPLEETSLDRLLQRRQSDGYTLSTGASSTHYALAGLSQLELWPTPGAADTVLFYYVALPAALSGNTDVPILQEPYASKLIEYGALAEAADFLKDPDVDKYRGLYDIWMKQFKTHLKRRAGSHTRSIPVARMVLVPHNPSTDIGC